MAQGLHLSQKMALSQVLAPQLQQSLALLQAPTLELKALVEQELQQNPVLEENATPRDRAGEQRSAKTPAADRPIRPNRRPMSPLTRRPKSRQRPGR